MGVERIDDNGSAIGLSSAYTRFARTCNFKSSNGAISRGPSTLARLATKGKLFSRRSLICFDPRGKACNDPVKSSLLRRPFVALTALFFLPLRFLFLFCSLCNLIYLQFDRSVMGMLISLHFVGSIDRNDAFRGSSYIYLLIF